MALKGGELLTAQLRAEGVEVIFGIPGIHLMDVLDALYHEPGIRFITTRHEQATTYMADGYARTLGKPGVAMVVPGPGVYNAGAGLSNAWATSSPVMLIAAQIEQHGVGKGLSLPHEVHDQIEIVKPVTKYQQRIGSVDELASGVRTAIAAMMDGRQRPVEIEMSPELFRATAAGGVVAPEAPVPHEPDPELIARAARLLSNAHEPVILAGGGVVLGNAHHAFTRVAEKLQASVINTREGKGAIDERNPLFVGTAWVNRRLKPVIAAADVILAVGTRYQGIGLVEGQTLIHIDVDPTEFGKHAKPTLAIEGDARRSLELLLEQLELQGVRPRDRRAERQAAKARIDAELALIGPQVEMVRALRRGIPEDGILAVDATTPGYMCHLSYPVYNPRTYLTSSFMGTLGFAFPTALGAKIARPDLPVFSINGDGGFLFNSSELATAVQYGINTVNLVFNDSAYGNTNRDQLDNFGGRSIGTELVNPDFAKLAEAFGAVGMKLRGVEQLEGAIREALAENRPAVIEIPMERLPPFM